MLQLSTSLSSLSPSLSLPLSLSLSLSPSLFLPLSLSISFSLSLPLSLAPSPSLDISLSHPPSLSPPSSLLTPTLLPLSLCVQFRVVGQRSENVAGEKAEQMQPLRWLRAVPCCMLTTFPPTPPTALELTESFILFSSYSHSPLPTPPIHALSFTL